ncbi:MAG: DctP family TRAP transporter solute-binding subunit [Rhodoferax sp.]|nr:DctP family TRAP transporter solute-binding subunit [Rhodoferax sp.]
MQSLWRTLWTRLVWRVRGATLCFGLCAGGLLTGLAAAATPAVPPVLVRFSHVVAPDTPKGQMVQHFQALVAQRSNGRIRVEVYPDSQLYGDHDEIEALQLGAVEILAPSLSKFSAMGVHGLEVFDLPFLFQNLQQIRCVTHGAIGQQLLEDLSNHRMVGLGFLDNGFKQMSARKPLQNPADFKGLRLRIQASRVLAAQMRALGAYPVVLPFGETQRALASGVVDGTENPLSNFLTQGLAAMQPAVTLTDHGYLGYAVVANPRFWAHLSTPDRDLLQRALSEALEHGNRISATLNAQALAALQQSTRVHIHALSAPQREVLRQAMQPLYTDFQRRRGAALLQHIQHECTP